MAELINALIIVLCINAVLFIGQAMLINANPDITQGNTLNYDFKNSPIGQVDKNSVKSFNNLSMDKSLIYNQSAYPDVSTGKGLGGVLSTIVSSIADIFTGLKNWFFQATGISYLIKIISAPYDFLIMTGLPSIFCFAIGSMWYLLTIFLIINWWKGGFA